MSDDNLFERLHELGIRLSVAAPLAAIKRIEELEAKLAKSLEALEIADAALSGANMNMLVVERKVKAAIAELKGKKDDRLQPNQRRSRYDYFSFL